ncbi:membrane protein [Paenibacillus sp. J2TS4]|nr:membrane protein [Paenibacillus sp. J2TS4]
MSGPAQAYTQREKVEGYSANLIYRRYTGTDSGQEAIVIPSIDRMRRANQSSSYRGRPGSLGDLLRRNYIQTNVWGNADVEGEAESEGTGSGKGLRRYAAFALMTRQGTVEQGDVSQATLMPSPYHAGGVTTDYSFLTNKWRQRADRSISLLELGDLQRLYTFKSRYSENSFLAHQQVVLKEIDHFIGTVRNQIGDNEELWILSPGVHSEANRRKLTMSPLLLYRKDGQRGLVRTESTRRDGIVTLLDLTPTITDRLGLGNEKDWTGKAVSIKPYEQPLSFLQRELGRMEAVYRLRPPLLTAFTVYEMIVLFFGLYFVWFQKNRDSPIMRALLWSILVAPVLLFALGWGVGGSGLVISQGGSGVHAAASHGSYGTWIDISQVVLLVVMLAAISAGLARMNLLAAFSLIGVVTASVLLLDGWTGAEVMKRSVLGYDPIIGARFYGMGNELMGVLVGSAALGTMAWAQNGRRASRISWRQGSLAAKPLLVWGLAGGYAALLLYLAMPSGGANAGGAITASVALGMSWLGLGTADRPPRPRIRTIWLILVLLITALIVLWVANAVLKGASSSHIGDSFRYLLAGNGGEIRSIIARKLKMNLHLIRVSIWSKVVLTCVLVIAALLLKPPRRMLCWKKAYPLLVNGWIAITMGAVVALVFNDSGIVAAGTMITYATVPMLLVAVEENAHSISSSH